jgi:hypothetical protein
MRGSLLTWGICVAALAFACGPSKDAKDPSEETKKEDTPKWEGAAPPPPPLSAEDTSSGSKPAKSSSGGAVQEAPAKRTDVYDKEATEVALKRAARQVKDNCGHAKDENGKAIGPWGKVTLQVQLGHNGHSKGITVPPPYQGKPSGNCVEKAFTNLTYPPWAGADTEVAWEVEIVEPGKEGKK